MAVDPHDAVDESNPLRQVIINTHSPVVVRSLPEDALVIAKSLSSKTGALTTFNALSGTWRTRSEAKYRMGSAQLGDLMSYLEERPKPDGQSANVRTVLEFAHQGLLPFMLEKNK
jgi:hypothetical protein